jgi:hypothetical protein
MKAAKAARVEGGASKLFDFNALRIESTFGIVSYLGCLMVMVGRELDGFEVGMRIWQSKSVDLFVSVALSASLNTPLR